MKHFLLVLPLSLALAIPAVAAPGQTSKQGPARQTRKSDYWLSRDMQRLVFWQPHDRAGDTAR